MEKKKPTAEETVDPSRELVEVFVPRGAANDEPNLLVSINSVNYLLPRGKKSMVPRFVKDEIDRAEKAKEAYDDLVQMMLESNQ